MDRRQFFKDKHVELKSLNGGVKPLKKEFLKFCKLQEDQLMRAFGKDAYSTLQGECGDAPNKLKMERASLPVILEQYGSLARKYQRVPVHADWLMEDFYPRPGGLSRIHKITFANFPTIFVQENGDRPEWKDVVNILKQKSISSSDKTDRAFERLVQKIVRMKPRQEACN